MSVISAGFPKIVTPSSFDWSDDVVLSSLVDDPDVFRKTAGSKVVDLWGPVEPIPGHSIIHLIALSDFEKTGCNLNSDAFESHICKKLHPTFVKRAKLYRNHQVGPKKGETPKPGGYDEGYVIKSAHNDEMGRTELLIAASHDKCADWLGDLEAGDPVAFSMGFNCVFAGQLVPTRRGMIPIEEVTDEDETISSSGEWRKVTHTHINPLAGRKKVRVSATGMAEDLEVTDDHPVYVIRRDRVRTKGGHLRRHPEWEHEEVDAATISKGDYLVRPVRQFTGELSPGTDLAYIAGQYVGDGHMGMVDGVPGGAIHLTLHRGEVTTLRKLVEICLRNQWQFSVDYPKDVEATTFRIRSTYVADFCLTFGVKKRKHCPEHVFSWTQEDALSFLGGYHDADGCVSGEVLRFSSVLPEVAYGMQDLAFACGLPASLWKDHVGEANGSFGTAEWAYVGFIPRSRMATLAPYSIKVAALNLGEVERQHRIRFYEQDGVRFVAMPIKEVNVSNSDDESVYCLTVEGEHNFVASGALVHNCFYDECSLCGHKARNPREYCEHVHKKAAAPYGMGRILADGRKCFVFNRKGFFNDISKVGTGADMTAFDLRKVAHVAEALDHIPSGAELGEMYIYSTGDTDSSKVALARKISEMEKRIPAYAKAVVKEDEVEEKTASLLTSAHSPSDMFTYLASREVLLPCRQFFKVAMADSYSELSDDIEAVCRKMASDGGYTWAIDNGHLDRVCSNETYRVKPRTAFKIDTQKEARLLADHSHHSAWRSIRENRKVAQIAMADKIVLPDGQLTPKQAALACEYLAYKLTAIEAMPISLDREGLASVAL